MHTNREGPRPGRDVGKRLSRRNPTVHARHRATVLTDILSEASDSVQKADLHALRCNSGAAPVTKISGQTVLVQRRLAENGRFGTAGGHWAMAAIQRDSVGRKMFETEQILDPERRSKGTL